MAGALEFNQADRASPGGVAPGPADGAQIHKDSIPACMFDGSERAWLELIRDVVAVANSGGGEIVVRAAESPLPAESVSGPLSDVRRSDVLKRLALVTDSPFSEIDIRPQAAPGGSELVVSIGRPLFPIVFTHTGSFADPADPTKRIEVFAAGTVYFRHGETSEPGTSAEVRAFFERVLRRVRRRWLTGIRKVVNQPIDAAADVHRPLTRRKQAGPPNLQPVRITTDPDAPALQPQDVERLYPWRQKDLLQELNARLGRQALTSYDIQAVRRHHRLDERPEFIFHLPGAGRRYSPAVADWMMEQHQRDPEFFRKSRAADQEMLKLRRRKPR